MKKVLLDTSFILSCVRANVDFLEGLFTLDLYPIVPLQVLKELRSITYSKNKLKYRNEALLSLKMLKNNVETIDLEQKHVDNGIVFFLKNNESVLLASMDKGLSSRVGNRKVILRQKKKVVLS